MTRGQRSAGVGKDGHPASYATPTCPDHRASKQKGEGEGEEARGYASRRGRGEEEARGNASRNFRVSNGILRG